MKKITCIFYLSAIISFYAVSVHAQAKIPNTTISWNFYLDPAIRKATFFGQTDTLFSSNAITVGSMLTLSDSNRIATTARTVTFTRFLPTALVSVVNPDAKIAFSVKPKTGYAFTPIEISFDCERYGTDACLIDIIWKSSNGISTTLATGIKPARENSVPLTITHYDSTFAKYIPTSPGECSLELYVYTLGVGKRVGLSNVVISGIIKTFSESDKAPTEITWDIPQSIIYGTVLSATQLNAVAKGNTSSALYSSAVGTKLPAGEHNIEVTFPADDIYGTGTKTISLQVLKATSVIKWDNPEPIKEGTALSSKQLNATITGSTGAATYTPAIGTVLPAGKQTLSVTYAADANYIPASKSVSIEVIGALAIGSEFANNVFIYPNPASDYLQVKTTATQFTVEVIDITGKSMLKQGNADNIKIGQLAPGLYFVKITSAGQSTLKRLQVLR